MPHRKSWTDKDRNDLKQLVQPSNRDGRCLNWDAIRSRFPNQSRFSIYKQMYAWGMCSPRDWTPKEILILESGWNRLSILTLMKNLPGRSRNAVYEEALKLGLHAGRPPGMVSIRALSQDPRWGYDYYKTMKILRAGRVRIRVFNYAGTKQRGVRYVDRESALDAAGAWERTRAEQYMGKERVRDAAKRLRVRPTVLRTWLTIDGLAPPVSHTKHKFWAIPEVYDRVVARHR